jgi:2-deoxy-D-gluconate 3-dehydrogenase
MTSGIQTNEAAHERIVQRTPAGRFGTPAECAGAAVFLASSASDFVTGVSIPVDGGYAIM